MVDKLGKLPKGATGKQNNKRNIKGTKSASGSGEETVAAGEMSSSSSSSSRGNFGVVDPSSSSRLFTPAPRGASGKGGKNKNSRKNNTNMENYSLDEDTDGKKDKSTIYHSVSQNSDTGYPFLQSTGNNSGKYSNKLNESPLGGKRLEYPPNYPAGLSTNIKMNSSVVPRNAYPRVGNMAAQNGIRPEVPTSQKLLKVWEWSEKFADFFFADFFVAIILDIESNRLLFSDQISYYKHLIPKVNGIYLKYIIIIRSHQTVQLVFHNQQYY